MRAAMKHNILQLPILFLTLLLTAACSPPASSPASDLIRISITSNGTTQTAAIPRGTTVFAALESMDMSINPLDRIEPSLEEVLEEDTSIHITRIMEEFETETAAVPFTRELVRSETLPAGEQILLQAGENGLEEVTWRIVYENGMETSRTISSRRTLTEPVSEIIMLGIQPGNIPIPIDGVVAYLESGSAWIMRGTTHRKEPVVRTGDLDSRVFSLSPDGRWLLYTRSESESRDNWINSLWISSTSSSDTASVELDVHNIIHFAGWADPGPEQGYRIAYSTVEPRSAAPGWQANNDLRILSLSNSGRPLQTEIILDENPGGQYGWWGTNFTWSPDGTRFAFSRPDAVGVVELADPVFRVLLEVPPFEVQSDYVWMPQTAWASNSRTLLVNTYSPGSQSSTGPGSFQLIGINTSNGTGSILLENTGMFAYPEPAAESGFFLLAPVDITQPLLSSMRIAQIDLDGSNLTFLHPDQHEPGLSPFPIAASPSGQMLLFSRQENLWLYDLSSGKPHQITYSAGISAADWK